MSAPISVPAPAPATLSLTPDASLSEELKAEFARNAFNPCVGQVLLSQTDKVRVWHITIAPGERVGFHRHVLDYFWTALSAGTAQSHLNGGPAQRAEYRAGETRHLTFKRGEFLLHDLENIGTTPLTFVTVEFLASANDPLPLPASVTPRTLDTQAASA